MDGLAKYLLRRAADRAAVLFVALTLQFALLRVLPYYVLGSTPPSSS